MGRFRMAFTLLLLHVLLAGGAWSQEARSSITGRVIDPLGAVIPSASVAITNVETNVTSRTATNETGYFEVSLLNPGRYSLAVETPGFRRSVRSGIELSVASRLSIEIQMEVGAVTESIEVTAAAALLDTATASAGRVIDRRQIMELPFGDMNPFALSAMTPGMIATGLPEERRAFDIGGTSAFRTMGGVGSNEYTIDGAPATGTGRRVAFVPPPDAVEEFKIETAPFDASYGHSSGAIINVMTKSGTNTYHGSAYDQHWQQRWNATRHFLRLAWEDAVRSGKKEASDPKQASGRSNIFGGTLGAPVRIPKLYNGRDKFFFFFSYNGIYTSRQETKDYDVNRTVPKMAWRQGDFSDLTAIDAVKYTIYDPRSARQEGARVVRTPFPGNRGVPILNPVYKFYEPIYPKPTDVPGLVTPEGINNYFAGGMTKDWDFGQVVNRYDYNLTERHRVFGRWYWSHALENAYDWTYETMRGLHSGANDRGNIGASSNYVWTVSNTAIFDIGASWTQFYQGNHAGTRGARPTDFKASQVGLPAYMDAKAEPWHVLPVMVVGGHSNVSRAYPAIDQRGTTAELRAQLTSVRGSHSLKYGWQERRYWRATAGPGLSSGSFTFSQLYMRHADNTTTASDLGLSWAAFMMGLPSSITTDTTDTAYWTTRWRSFYVHDDWRVTRKLHLNMGLRYEREGGTSERFNRAIAGGFDLSYKPPFAALAEAAYARSPIAEMPAAQFKVLGGTSYLGQPNKTFTDGTHHLLPRFGLTYQVTPKTVLRSGYGWYYDTYNVNNDVPSMDGYSQPTNTTITNDLGLTICCGVGSVANLTASRNPMTDPFPVRADGTRFDAPYGNSLGPLMRQGRGWTFVPREYSPPWQQRWRLGVQQEITANMVIEVSYNGAFAKIPVTQRIDFLPKQYWAKGYVRVQAIDDDLNRNIPNPFNIRNLAPLQVSDPKAYAYLSTLGFFTGANIRKHQVLRAFPNINGLNGLRPGVDFRDARGGNKYHDMELRFERRFSRGLQSAVLYTYATGEVQNYYHNQFDSAPSWQVNNTVRPHRLVWSAIWELPFGKGRQWLTSNPMQHMIGGWQLSWIYQYQTGPATSWGNRFFYGDLGRVKDVFSHKAVHSKDIHVWFDPNIAFRGTGTIPQGFQGFEGRAALQPGSYHVRVFPTLLDSLRADGFRNWDAKVQRKFQITERLRTSFSVDLLNVTNRTNFDTPIIDPTNLNFGRVTGQVGISRIIQFNLRVDF